MKFLSIKLLPFWTSFLLSIAFFVIQLLTLKDYGPSWDETIHFRRGQAYLYYYLTGKLNYDDSPKYNLQGTNGDPKLVPTPRRSFYQNDIQNGEWFLKKDIGHPPLNGILASIFNYIFFQKLGILPDIFSYHLFNILISSLMVFIVSFFAVSTFGLFAGLISYLALITYPLFFSEAHFNIKDPVEAAFFSGVIWTFYQSIKTKKVKWLLATAIFIGLALGTKFNVLFIPLILFPYVLYLLLRQEIKVKDFSEKYFAFLYLTPLIGISIFLVSWLYLWQNFPSNLYQILNYYSEIGTGINYQPQHLYFFGFNIFPLLWIIFTTPVITLVLTLVGIYYAISLRKIAFGVTGLWLLWFSIPILRVTVPNTAIYGGVRQIMEFIPAMALLAGLGAYGILAIFKNSIYIKVLILIMFIWPVVVLFKLHPNQNVYLNFLIGGLKGAETLNFPSYGNSFGNAYLQGINWLNENVEAKAKVSLIQGTPSNAPILFFRQDINYLVNNNLDSQDTYFSGFMREGEYLMELTFNDTGKDFYYIWDYVEKFLKPLYEVKVDGVSILKIWKNDFANTYKDRLYTEVDYKDKAVVKMEKNNIFIDLNEQILLSSLQITTQSTRNCRKIKNGTVEFSLDNISWEKELDYIGQYQLYRKKNLLDNGFKFYSAGKKTKYIKITNIPLESCILVNPEVKIVELKLK